VLKVAIVGCGKIADSHVEQVRATGRADVVAVCDREPLMAEQLATRFRVPAWHSNLTAMLDRERPDVLHIATPPDSHLALAKLALAAGCHLFVEKPFALTAQECGAILAAAEATNLRVSVNYCYNFEAPGLELERVLREGALGEIVHLDTCFGYNLSGAYGLAVMSNPNHWVHRLPGKLFHNVLDHVLAKVVAHIGDDISAHVCAFRRRGATGDAVVDAMPDELRFILRSGAVTACGNVSVHGRPVAHTLRVVGTRDTVELDYAARTFVHSARQTQPSAIGRLFPPWVQARQFASNGWRNLGEFRRHEAHFFQCMRVLLHRFYDAIEHRAPDPVPHEQILRVCRIIDQIVKEIEDPTA
jgi:predicted dehydrogenase